MDIGFLEHLMEEVQQGRMELCPLSDLPIPPCPWRNITQMTSQFSSTFEYYGWNPSIISRSLVNSSLQGNDLGNVLPLMDTLTATSSPMAILTTISSPPDRLTQMLPLMDTLILTSLMAILTAISSPLDRQTQMLVPPMDTLTTRSSLMGILTAISSPPDRSIQTLLPPEGDIDNLDNTFHSSTDSGGILAALQEFRWIQSFWVDFDLFIQKQKINTI